MAKISEQMTCPECGADLLVRLVTNNGDHIERDWRCSNCMRDHSTIEVDLTIYEYLQAIAKLHTKTKRG